MSQCTLYEMLMVHPTADIEIITAVYRRLAKRHHPDRDRGPGASARMAELNEAFAILSDPSKRARYDRSLRNEMPNASRAAAAAGSGHVNGAWAIAVPVGVDPTEHGEAGPPPRYPLPSGSVFSFGRYRGWSISQVAYHDRDYLEWLQRAPSGRAFRQELDVMLGRRT